MLRVDLQQRDRLSVNRACTLYACMLRLQRDAHASGKRKARIIRNGAPFARARVCVCVCVVCGVWCVCTCVCVCVCVCATNEEQYPHPRCYVLSYD
jgi:hypothetical protein